MKIFRVLSILLVLIALALAGAVTVITQPFVSPIKFEPPRVDSTQLRTHVKRLSFDFYPRSFEQDNNTARTVKYISDQFAKVGAKVTVQEFLIQEATHRNVVARFGPATGKVLVIGAHYDSHGDANAGAKHPNGFSPNTHTPGADDNASGVAGLIVLAKLLANKPQQRAIELVAYATEEPPHFRTEHMGSVHHARWMRRQGRQVELMLSLEMIGYFTDEPNTQRFPLESMRHLYTDRGNFIALVGALQDFGLMRRVKGLMSGATPLTVHSINAPPQFTGIDFSDHRSYWKEGFAALMITDTAFLRNQHYHQPSDTFEKLDYRRMSQVVQAVYAITQGL